MILHVERSNWAKDILLPVLSDQCEIKLVTGEKGDFGDLDGFQFDSERFGGFLYFWSSGMVEYHLVNYKDGIEILPITSKVIEVDEPLAEAMSLFLEKVIEASKE